MRVFPPPRPAVYHPGLRLLHWLMAALIFVALPLGVWAAETPRGPQRSEILFFHKSIGMTVLGLVALRIVWRLVVGAPAYAEPLGRLTHAAARSAHIGLYALMIAMPVSGYLSSNGAGDGRPLVRSLFLSPPVSEGRCAEDCGGARRTLCSPGLIAFVLAAHLGAAVWHAAIRRDSVLTRMWPGFRAAPRIAKS